MDTQLIRHTLSRLVTTGALSLALANVCFGASSMPSDDEDDFQVKQWEEGAVAFPSYPKPESLQAIYVSASTDNQFLVDMDSVTVAKEGVVRYTLVVLTAGGARNVTYEGMRCDTRERRLYASGRADGTWSKARNSQWQRIQEAVTNRQYAALFTEYFCPGGVIVFDAAEAKDALRRGGHPSVMRR